MLVGSAFVGLFVLLDLAVTWPNYAALITLSGSYAAATSDVQRAAFIAAASYADAALPFSLSVYSILGLATGILGIVSVVGPVFVSALGATIILASVLTLVWLFFAGYRLYRLGQQ